MGRKPNALVLQYFERGPKLEDSSNRYQHTCKSCGERFPKGRLDSLVNHLIQKCTSLSFDERKKILARTRVNALAGHSDYLEICQNSDRLKSYRRGRQLEPSFSPGPQQSFNALNVLAEVSRQVGGTERKRFLVNLLRGMRCLHKC